MPEVVCSGCGRRWAIKQKELTFLLRPNKIDVCSMSCLTTYLQQLPSVENNSVYLTYHRNGGKRHQFWSSKTHENYMSGFEMFVAESLYDAELPFVYEKYYFNVGTTIYVPDFYVTTKDVFLEVKGKWGVNSKKKLLQFKQENPTVNHILVSWLANDK